jgi:hypothetical protein
MANPSGGQSRLFMIVVIGLVGLLMIGLVAIAGLVVYSRFLAPTPSPSVVAEATSTPAVTVAPTSTRLATPVGTATAAGEGPTATRVIQEGSPTAVQTREATATPTVASEGGGEMAPTGFGPLEALVGGVGLLLVILLVRRLRLSSHPS